MWIKKLLRALIPLVIIAAGLAVAGHFLATKPKARRARPVRQTPLVEIMEARTESSRIVINAMGTVKPSRIITLESRVSGQVKEISDDFVPGGLFNKDDLILKIDPEDFELDVRKQKSQVSKAYANIQLEKGRKEVAENEVRLMKSISKNKIQDTSLALRKPQMAQARAELNSAKVALEQAELDLKRTEIKAPFNCLVTERSVDSGSQVSAQEKLAELVGTDSFWIEASIHVDELHWIDIPVKNGDNGSPVTIKTPGGIERQGEVIRLLGDMNTQSRMARILISVEDPLNLKTGRNSSRLLLGSYLSVSMQGRQVDNIIRLPRSAFRDGEQVWLLKQGKLFMQPVGTVWRSEDYVFVDQGIKPGDKIVSTDLAAPVNGMELRLKGGPETNKPVEKKNKPAGKKRKES